MDKECAKFKTIILKRQRRKTILPGLSINWKRHKKNIGLYAARVVGPQGLVVGVDLQDAKKTSIAKAAEIMWFCDDIMSDDIVGKMQGIRETFSVVLSDMAPRTSGNKWVDQQQSLTLARRVLELAANSVRKSFKTVKIVKPKSSRSESPEVFVLGIGFLKLKNED
jgi:23S rRNA (uridine2552-2'-O)-methyltransferase